MVGHTAGVARGADAEDQEVQPATDRIAGAWLDAAGQRLQTACDA
jgi:hypothetical protein